jgi:hypothetical protein
MSIRLLLAALLALFALQAPAQYGPGYPPMQDSPIYQGLWWNPAESGWGLNTTHQGNVIFATLFTYASDGAPLWLVASNLARVPMGGGGYGMGGEYEEEQYSYSGPLYRTTGPAFNQVPWTSIGFGEVGTMTITWLTPSNALLTYTFNGAPVTKLVQRQVFASPVPECVATSGSRAAEANYQDLWWNPAESGWGINLVHQGALIFATLFTYGDGGRDKWFVASGLARQADGAFTGALYATTGPAFNTSPWQPIGFGQVGNMRLAFSDGENGTLTYNVGTATVTKQIQRQVFGSVTAACR